MPVQRCVDYPGAAIRPGRGASGYRHSAAHVADANANYVADTARSPECCDDRFLLATADSLCRLADFAGSYQACDCRDALSVHAVLRLDRIRGCGLDIATARA